jgi:hypothetical protein
MIDKDVLYDLYYNKKMSLKEVGIEVGVSSSNIQYVMKKHGFTARTYSEGAYLRDCKTRNIIEVTDKLHDFIVGNILGDGGVYSAKSHLERDNRHPPRTANYIHSDKHQDITNFISKTMTSFGIRQMGNIGRYEHKKLNNAVYYQYRSKHYPELLQFRKKMYKDGHKIIPNDLVFTGDIVLYWFLGDGSLTYPATGRPYIRICTEGFTQEDVEFAVNQFNSMGMQCSRTSDNSIRFSAYATEPFMNFIGKCPKEIEHIYGYKFTNN